MSQAGKAHPDQGRTSFSISSEVEREITVIAVHGELDLSTASQLEASMEAVSTPGLVIDLSACEFIDSTGIALLVNGFRKADEAGRRIALCGLKRQVGRVLEIARVDGLIPATATREEAIAAVAG